MLRIVAAVTWLMASAAPLGAQTFSIGDATFDFSNAGLAPRDGAQKDFVAAFRKAKVSGDPAAMAALVHPAARACMGSPVSKAYFDERMQRDASTALPDNAKIIFLERATQTAAFDQLAGRGDLTTLPVAPSHIVAMDFTREERDAQGVLVKHVGNTIIRQLAPHDGRLMLVEYCLTAKGEEMFAKKPRAGQPAKP